MHKAISQGLDWAVSNIWLSLPSLSKYQPILLVEDQLRHQTLSERAFAILLKPCLHTELFQLLEEGIFPQVA
jgi:hypothetical protein